ncbi:hypothetical protein ABT093_38260 [Kitasatospora sp. NPDC002551]|uniref:hypothetical protein n=1 Tax=Kitasatospora sp. NPDC002551 TaxID=3154539 RepID=UPI00332C530D
MTIPAEVDEALLPHALLRHFERVAPLGEHTTGPRPGWEIQAGSALADDDANTGPHQLSLSAHHALVVAVGHLQALAGRPGERYRERRPPRDAAAHPRPVHPAAGRCGERRAGRVAALAPASRRERVHRCLRIHLAASRT